MNGACGGLQSTVNEPFHFSPLPFFSAAALHTRTRAHTFQMV